MRLRIAGIWDRLGSTLWLVPGLVACGGILLALALIELSDAFGAQLVESFPKVFGVDAASSRSALAAIAGSIVTVAGVTFSITVLVIAQASSQYTSRVLRSFMRDRPSQISLGVLIAVFLYCLVVIRTIRTDADPRFVPALAVVGAFVLATVAIATLVYFVHRVASTLDAGTIIERVSRDTIAAIDRVFPRRLDEPPSADDCPRSMPSVAPDTPWYAVHAARTGYVQQIEVDSLQSLAKEHHALIRLECEAGGFVIAGTPLMYVRGTPPGEGLAKALVPLVIIGTYRTVLQDVRFGIRQLVDIALKALSPGMNDVTTAVTCLDYLCAVLLRLAPRRIAPSCADAADADGLILCGPTFAGLVAESFEEIRHAAASNPRVLKRMLEIILEVAAHAPARRRPALHRQAERILRTANATMPLEEDRAAIQKLVAQILSESNVSSGGGVARK